MLARCMPPPSLQGSFVLNKPLVHTLHLSRLSSRDDDSPFRAPQKMYKFKPVDDMMQSSTYMHCQGYC